MFSCEFCKISKTTFFTEHLRWAEACNFIKKETLAQVFSCEFYKIFKNIFFYRTPLVCASGSTNKKAELKRNIWQC